MLYGVAHKSNFATGCQSLLLLFQIHMSKAGMLPDRFYRAVYTKMLSPELFESKRHALFLNIVKKTEFFCSISIFDSKKKGFQVREE